MNMKSQAGKSRQLAGLERLITRQIEHELARGMQVYVSLAGDVLVDSAFGVRAQDDQRITTDTRFAIFSSSKPLTATALHLLVEKGEVSYLDPVARYIPEFAQSGKADVTLRHLLLHQAGIADPSESVSVEAYVDFADAIARICRLSPEHAPGASTTYHVLTGMAVIAEVVQRVSGTGFREFCDAQVFQPLGMHHTTFGLPVELTDEATDTVGVSADRVGVCATWSGPVARAGLHPAIGAYATASDLGRFYEGWLSSRTCGGGLVSPPIARMATRLHAPATPTYGFGYGFFVGSDPALLTSRGSLCSVDTFGHPGMCSSLAFADPVSQLVVLLANGDPGQAESDRRFALLSDAIYRAVS